MSWKCAVLLLAAPALFAQDIAVETLTLDNGMKILVKEDHNIPNVAMYLFFKIGSRNERPGATGLSHFFEHMMFNGAKKFGPKQFDNEMEKAGGANNAYTTPDVTVYTDWFPKTALDLMFNMESDRIRDLAFDPKIISSERGVVYSERRTSVDNNNFGALHEQLNAATYTAHPYHWPVVGWPSDIESWTMDDLRAHFAMGYAPNNCVMVVVGDVTVPQVFGLAHKYMESIPRHDPPPPVRTVEPDQHGPRRVILHKAAQLPMEMIAYHVPETKHPDITVLELIDTMLTGGQSSRLYRRIVDREELALSVRASLQNHFDPGTMVFTMQPRNGVQPERAEAALLEELDRLKNELAPEAELRKAKNQQLADLYRERKTIAQQANLLGNYEVFYGDYRKAFTADKEIEAVTAADIQRVAKKYFTDDNRTVAILEPRKEGTK